MDLGLKGKVAVVAGSSQGLGRAVADALAAEGVDLVINSRSPEKLLVARSQIISNTGARVEIVPCDLSAADGASDLISAAKSAFGRVDILVTNTGGPPPGMFEDHGPEVWRDAIAQNFEIMARLFTHAAAMASDHGVHGPTSGPPAAANTALRSTRIISAVQHVLSTGW